MNEIEIFICLTNYNFGLQILNLVGLIAKIVVLAGRYVAMVAVAVAGLLAVVLKELAKLVVVILDLDRNVALCVALAPPS